MTIAVAVRTGSAAVFAADSKVTVRGLAGLETDGSPRWVNQTYDNAVKVVHDRTKTCMALFAGHVNIGVVSAIDFFMTSDLSSICVSPQQESDIQALVEGMDTKKRDYWNQTEVEPSNWPGPSIMVASPSSAGAVPRIWSINLWGEAGTSQEILFEPGIRLGGSFNEVYGLLYGYHPEVLEGLANHLEIESEKIWTAAQTLKVLTPLQKLNLWTIPVQDAIDLAVFLANVQVEMDRFLPGEAACGGPIDVMVLQMAPERAILTLPGKILRHPNL
jgi:hypothetical protein